MASLSRRYGEGMKEVRKSQRGEAETEVRYGSCLSAVGTENRDGVTTNRFGRR